MNFPITVKTDYKGCPYVVELYDATENPLYTMAVAWETMLGDPRKVIETGEYENVVEEILKAKHKTVFEYISLSLRIYSKDLSGSIDRYLRKMASCRAGFSVIQLPRPDYVTSAEIGCNFASILAWVHHGIEADPLTHRAIMPAIINAVTLYNPELGNVLQEVYDAT
jgi:hypothetical protein